MRANGFVLSTVSLRQGWPLLVLFVAVVVVIGLVVGLIAAPGDYVTHLKMPDLVLPPAVSSALWFILAFVFAVTGWRMWMLDSSSTEMRLWLAIQILSWWWSPIFFLIRSPVIALLVMIVMCALSLWFVIGSWHRDRISSLLFIPIFVYLAYVAAMNGAIVALN